MSKNALLRFDGGSRGNPGIGGCGFVLIISPNTKQEEHITGANYLGNNVTNNYAEYSGIIQGLKCALREQVTHIHIEGDSMLVISQLLGTWKVKSENIKHLYEKAFELLQLFTHYGLSHILRKENKEADKLANIAMDHPELYNCESKPLN